MGLGSVENTALSTWAGSANITTLGTITSGTVPWARLSSVPGTFTPSAHTHAIGDLSTVGDWSSKITSGTYSINVTGSAGSVAWGNVSGRPTAVSAFTNDSGYQTSAGSVSYANSAGVVAWGNVSGKPAAMANMTSKGVRAYELGCGNSYNEFSCDNGGNGYIDYADSAGYATSAGSANGVAWGNVSGRPTALSQFTNDSGFQTSSGSVNYANSAGSATSAGNANTVGGYGPAQIANAYTHDASWTWQDDYLALPTGTIQWGVFTPRAVTATVQSVVCWADTGDAVLQLRRNDGGDMINGALACNGTATTNLNGYNYLPVGYFIGMWEVSGTAKRINVGITYTTAY